MHCGRRGNARRVVRHDATIGMVRRRAMDTEAAGKIATPTVGITTSLKGLTQIKAETGWNVWSSVSEIYGFELKISLAGNLDDDQTAEWNGTPGGSHSRVDVLPEDAGANVHPSLVTNG